MSLLDLFDPVFGGHWLAVLLGPPYRTAEEVRECIDRAYARDSLMTLKAQMQADLAILFNTNEFAETVTYKINDSGATKSIAAIIDISADLGVTAQGRGMTGTATIKGSDIARPEIYDEMTTATGRVWRVESIIGGDGITWNLFVTSDNRAVPR